jgi:hypothetical protein
MNQTFGLGIGSMVEVSKLAARASIAASISGGKTFRGQRPVLMGQNVCESLIERLVGRNAVD